MGTNLLTHRELLRDVARQLNQWADESLRGGWSTHQVKAQRDLAARIYQHLDRTDLDPEEA